MVEDKDEEEKEKRELEAIKKAGRRAWEIAQERKRQQGNGKRK